MHFPSFLNIIMTKWLQMLFKIIYWTRLQSVNLQNLKVAIYYINFNWFVVLESHTSFRTCMQERSTSVLPFLNDFMVFMYTQHLLIPLLQTRDSFRIFLSSEHQDLRCMQYKLKVHCLTQTNQSSKRASVLILS